MSLKHKFIIRGTQEDEEICACISDDLLHYFYDTFQWIQSDWGGKKTKQGLPYYGFSVIKGDNIIKISDILKKWIELFAIAPEEFSLTGNYLIADDKYERIFVNKKEAIRSLTSLVSLLEKGVNNDLEIIYEGL